MANECDQEQVGASLLQNGITLLQHERQNIMNDT